MGYTERRQFWTSEFRSFGCRETEPSGIGISCNVLHSVTIDTLDILGLRYTLLVQKTRGGPVWGASWWKLIFVNPGPQLISETIVARGETGTREDGRCD